MIPGDPKITARGDSVVNFIGVTCLSCHQAAVRFDFVCEKGYGCAPVPLTEEMIVERQSKDPRCPANPDTGKRPGF